MATDNTPPRLKLIATIAVITVITLFAVNFALTSYFAIMTDEAAREKMAPTRDRDEQRKAEEAALTGAVVPIDRAMLELERGTRPASIAPQQSEDTSALVGWSKLPKPAPTVAQNAGASLADSGVTTGDAGVLPLATDAGAPAPRRPVPVGDAGVRRPIP